MAKAYDELLLHAARRMQPRRLRKSAFRKFCRRNRGAQHIAELNDGFHMHVTLGDSVDNQIYVNQTYEPATTAAWHQFAKVTDHLVDVGCNIGYFSCLYARLKSDAHILAFDPNPAMAERTQQNLDANGHRTYQAINEGLAAARGELELFVPEHRHSTSSFAYEPPRGSGGSVSSIRVPVTTIDQVFQDNDLRNVLLKVDTEGFEYEVFKGISASSIERINVLVFEYSSITFERAGVPVDEMFQFDWMADFDAFRITPNGLQPEHLPPRYDRNLPFFAANIALIKSSLTDTLNIGEVRQVATDMSVTTPN